MKDKCDLSNEELTTMCRQWVSKLCETGGKAWTLEIPANYNKDPDLLICELIDRFKKNQSIISPSTGFTEEEMQHMAIEKYCTPFGRPNPETYAFIEGLKYIVSRNNNQ